jgi:plastocyanin
MRTARLALLTIVTFLPACQGEDATIEPCADPVSATTVELADFAFRPDCMSVDAASTIGLENTGEAPHTFTVADTDLDVKLDPGTSDEISFGTVDPGAYPVTCTFHPQMEATITVS